MNPIQDALNDALVVDFDEDCLLLVLHFHPQNGKSKTFDSEDFKFHLRPRPQPRPSSSDLLVNQDGSKKCKVTSLSVDDEAALEMGTPFTTHQTNQQGPCPQTPVDRRNLSFSLVESTIQTPAPTRFSLRTPPRLIKPKPRLAYKRDSAGHMAAIVEGLAPLTLPPLPR